MDLIMICPKCGKEAKSVQTRYGIRNACCDLVSWGNGELVDKETRIARMAAHLAFDPLWKQGLLSRSKAYRILASKMKMDINKCHMKLMDKETALKVREAVKQIKEDYGFTT